MKTWPRYFLLRFNTVISQSLITTLPGFTGNLPLKLETDILAWEKTTTCSCFTNFIESENDPQKDPLVLWISGGSGCSGFSGLVYEVHWPLIFLMLMEASLHSVQIHIHGLRLPTLYSSTLLLKMDSHMRIRKKITIPPTVNQQKIITSFCRRLSIHPTFNKDRLYIAVDSHGGKITPMVAVEIAKGNEAGFQPRMLLQDTAFGNARTAGNKDENEKIPYAHRIALYDARGCLFGGRSRAGNAAGTVRDGDGLNSSPKHFHSGFSHRIGYGFDRILGANWGRPMGFYPFPTISKSHSISFFIDS
ncbi:hypothetical protein OROGR_009757 [Orobanche gracilis]